MPHYNSFLPLIPSGISLEHAGLELYRESLYQIADKKETIVRRVQEFVKNNQWNGVILTAAPTEVLNPGLYDALKATLSVPFTTALHACVMALSVYSAKRVLLLTPFDEKLNQLICRHLEGKGVAANLDEVGSPFGPAAVDRRRTAMPSARAGDRLGLVLVLVDHVLEGLVGDGRLDGRTAVQGEPLRVDGRRP